MEFQTNYQLSKLTTFQVGGPCLFFAELTKVEDWKEIVELAKQKNLPVLVMGGGSNMVVADSGFPGIVVRIAIKGLEIANEDKESATLRVGAGEVWDDAVKFATEKNLWGLENLSGIPGFTGAVPVQNVGAYGADASMAVESVEVLDRKSLITKILTNQECGFGYRQSIFNTTAKGQYVILRVSFKLSKIAKPNLTYADVKKYFETKPNPTLAEIRQAIIEIRKNKFPDVKVMGNAGSCFKNLILDEQHYKELEENIKENFPEPMLSKLQEIKNKFPMQGGIKIPAAFLIDICGLKGKYIRNAVLWDKQPLVIVNAGNVKAEDILELFNLVKDKVREKTGMILAPEPEFVGL